MSFSNEFYGTRLYNEYLMSDITEQFITYQCSCCSWKIIEIQISFKIMETSFDFMKSTWKLLKWIMEKSLKFELIIPGQIIEFLIRCRIDQMQE